MEELSTRVTIFIIVSFILLVFMRGVVSFILESREQKRRKEEKKKYPEFINDRQRYCELRNALYEEEEKQREIQKQIETTQTTLNYFPPGVDLNNRIKKIEELRFFYLSQQQVIDNLNKEEQKLRQKLDSMPKPDFMKNSYW